MLRDGGQELAPAEAGGAIASNYRNAGKTCVCANRILVQDGVHDAFTKRLAKTAGTMKVADGFERGAVIGPLIDMKAVEKVEAHIADALKKGAKVVTGGKRAAQRGREGGAAYFYSRDIGRIWRVAEALEYGIVGINQGIISDAKV